MIKKENKKPLAVKAARGRGGEQPQPQVGIVAYGTSLPGLLVSSAAISQAQGRGDDLGLALNVSSKTVPARDEDTATLAAAAALQALDRASQVGFELNNLGSLLIGSESHPYAVKPTGTMVAAALGLPKRLSMADLQFACKAGTQSMQLVAAQVAAGQIISGLAIGADTAQSQPGDALELTAAAGGAAYLIGSDQHQPLLANLLATTSYASDTPDFWRRTLESYPSHGGRFTGEPAYFHHLQSATADILHESGLEPSDFDHCIFHTPNGKFPKKIAKSLGFSPAQLEASLVVGKIGNTYAGAVPLALAAVLDQAKSHQKILVMSYGSGAGSDGFVFETTTNLPKWRKKWRHLLADQIRSATFIDLPTYFALRQSGH